MRNDLKRYIDIHKTVMIIHLIPILKFFGHSMKQFEVFALN